MPPVHPKIFVSSTYVDLRSARAKVIRWLGGIFGASLIVMETSGSDTAPPNVTSIRRVRQCDIFVGIYAHRYGTIDPASGESITELELDEAQSAQSVGVLRDILLYRIDPKSTWLSDFADTTVEAQVGRARLEAKINKHTYSIYRNETELLFHIVRDVYRSISQRFFTQPRVLRSFNSPSARPIHRPIGMEFLTSSDAEHLIGRGDAIHDAMVQLNNEKMVLLLGESGVGKTSLIHAGIIPRAAVLGWRSVYARPLGMPSTDVVDQIESSVFVDGIRHAPLLQTVAELLGAIGDEHLLLVIDQFEDVLNTTSLENLEELLSGLAALRELSEPKLHILISYRADLEGRLGTMWQRITGSPRGLARVYIGGLNISNFWDQVEHTCVELGIGLRLTTDEMARVLSELAVASKNWTPSGLYPPYVQMLIDSMYSSSRFEEPFTFNAYQKAGGIFGIVRDYLSKQLSLAQDDAGELRLLLISLVKSYGVKAQRSLKELAADTGLDIMRCEAQLERLIDLRLVRHISGQYEVSHDFLAKIILDKLVDSEEREFKRFRELLSSRAAAFANTSNRLTVEEVLFLYKYRQRIVYNSVEAVLLIHTWIKDDVPGLFWIKDFDRNLIERHLATYESVDLEPREKFRIVTLKYLFGILIINDDYLASMKLYVGAQQVARMLIGLSDRIPTDILLLGLRRRQSAIKGACGEILTRRVERSEWDIIHRLRMSQTKSCLRLFFEMVCNPRIPTLNNDQIRAFVEFRCLQLVVREPPNSAHAGLKILRSIRPRLIAEQFGEAADAIRRGNIERVLASIAGSNAEPALPMIFATEAVATDDDFRQLLGLYVKLNHHEANSGEESVKATELARGIRYLANPRRIATFREMFAKIELGPSARDIAVAILANGDLDDVTLVLLKIASCPTEMRYENHAELCSAAKQSLLKSSREIPDQYLAWARSRNFWVYFSNKESHSVPADDLLPVDNLSNRPLFIRLLAHAILGLVRSGDNKLLQSLVGHKFVSVSSAAAVRMSELIGAQALSIVSKEVDNAISAGRAGSLASAIRSAEENLYIRL